MSGARATVVRPRWLVPTSLALCLFGIGVSAYLSYEHLTANRSLACIGGPGDTSCLTVTTSAWSYLLGIPVAYLGLAWFVVMTVLCLPVVWRLPDRRIDWVRLALVIAGLIMVLYLVWAELFRIHAICAWCTTIHVDTFLLLGVIAAGQILSERLPVSER